MFYFFRYHKPNADTNLKIVHNSNFQSLHIFQRGVWRAKALPQLVEVRFAKHPVGSGICRYSVDVYVHAVSKCKLIPSKQNSLTIAILGEGGFCFERHSCGVCLRTGINPRAIFTKPTEVG